MASTEITDADPLIETPRPPSPAMDYAQHVRTYNRFLNLVKWFVIHALIMMPALYFLVVGGQPVTGTILLFIAVGALCYGLFRNPSVRHDIDDAMTAREPADAAG